MQEELDYVLKKMKTKNVQISTKYLMKDKKIWQHFFDFTRLSLNKIQQRNRQKVACSPLPRKATSESLRILSDMTWNRWNTWEKSDWLSKKSIQNFTDFDYPLKEYVQKISR